MKPVECPFEADVLEAVMRGCLNGDLRAHSSNCEICAEVASVAGIIGEAHEASRAEATLPDAGRVWWLARLRAKREAAEAASHAITLTQVLALTCIVGVLGACFGATSLWFQSALRSITVAMSEIDMITLLAEHGALAAGMIVVLFVLPAVVYLAIGKEER